ncbi:MAG: glycoside hydrolase family 92 protein, partial [Ignavibacteriales bacterium]|nr:glycoside hydrolase family 92 protein [Ignavibacteriales bacterium]
SDISGMIGQYAQGNEPSHHVAYLYNYAGKPWKTQQTVRMIMDSLFTEKPDGICGNDDCGQMSAWYVMSALGLYQVCPGDPTYAVGSPLFKRATIHLENGKTFVVQANDNSSKNKFIQSASQNGKSISTSFLQHEQLMEGGTLQLKMGSRPNEQWGSEVSRSSTSTKQIVIVPYIEASGKTFSDSMEIRFATPTSDAKIYFTLDGTTPTTSLSVYQSPVWLNKTITVKAIAAKEGMIDSRLMSAVFTQFKPVGTLTLHTQFDAQYTAGGNDALIDGIRGGTDFRNGEWQGYHEVDLDAVLDLGESKEVKQVMLGCLQDNNSWIFFPTQVTFSFSDDGKNFSNEQTIPNDI